MDAVRVDPTAAFGGEGDVCCVVGAYELDCLGGVEMVDYGLLLGA